MKICSKCKEQKQNIDFYKNRNNKDGLSWYCIKCSREYQRNYVKINKTKIEGYHKAYYQTHIDKFRQYREDNKEHFKEYRKTNRRKIKKYFEDNKETLKEKALLYRKKNKEKRKKYREEHKEQRKEYDKKNKNKKASYAMYKDRLTIDENPKLAKDGVSLFVKCRYCGKYFIPTERQAVIRARALTGHCSGECNLYCSSGCKKACPTFGQREHYKGQKVDGSSREVQPELRQMCLERDGYTCQKCGAKGKAVQLHCHHIKAVIDDPIESADVDNTITLCKSCHKEVHKIPGCRYHELRCAK